MTASMRIAADILNWIEVVEHATARHQYLLQHFELFPVGPENAEFYRHHLSTMLNGEQELQNLARNARKSLMSEGVAISQGHRAVGMYLNSARGYSSIVKNNTEQSYL